VKRHPKSFWAGLVAELRAGALVADVARRHRVREVTLRWWRSQLRDEHASPRLLPVIAAPAPQAVRHLEIAVGVAVVRVEEGTDVQYVAALARALSAPC
jgi:transposase-like protein